VKVVSEKVIASVKVAVSVKVVASVKVVTQEVFIVIVLALFKTFLIEKH
jgi:hypothetical protein